MNVTLIPEIGKRLDLLNRQEFVDHLLIIAQALSKKKKNACYAINGDWGVGKSFVLDMFEEQAIDIGVEGKELSRYLIFRYNCWEYDYYDEPLVAIVAAMLDQISKKEDLLPADAKTRITAVLKVIGKGLLKKTFQLVEEKTEIDLKDITEVIKNGVSEAEKDIYQAHEYDQYFDFKKKLNAFQKTIAELAHEQTVIFIVDELDRCLPEYTIKVLERLHHLCASISNVQLMLSIDEKQLEHVVRQIYGEQTEAKKYLKKFIDFELKLGIGTLNDRFNERFKEYVAKFELLHTIVDSADVEEFNSMLLDGMDIRSRISVIDRCLLLHDVIGENSVIDISFMCLELFLVILNDSGINLQKACKRFRIDHLFEANNIYDDTTRPVPKGLLNLSERYSVNMDKNGLYYLFSQDNGSYYIWGGELWGVILGAYRYILGFENDHWKNDEGYKPYYIRYIKKFWDILQIIS